MSRASSSSSRAHPSAGFPAARLAVSLDFMLALLLASLLSITPATATGAPTGPGSDRRGAAKAEVQKAQISYKLGRFDDALEAYARAYELFNAPALLFNIGQCHKNLKNYDRAVFFFEGYLREETKPDPRKRTLAEELLAESRAEIEKQRLVDEDAKRAAAAAARPHPPTQSVAEVFGPAPGAAPAAPVLIDAPGDTLAATKKPLTQKWWFWTAIGAGALVVAGGALAYYLSGPSTTVLPAGSVGTLDGR